MSSANTMAKDQPSFAAGAPKVTHFIAAEP
jgi:hypothetical protein